MMVVVCPGCSTHLKVQEHHYGQTLECSSCRQQFVVPVAQPPAHDESRPTNWYYIKEGWFNEQEIGPMSDREFLIQAGRRKLGPMTRVRSPVYTNNQWYNLLVFLTSVDSKSVRHSSIASIERFTDGVLAVRTSGASVFARFVDDGVDNHKIALLMERVCLEGRQVTAFLPSASFATAAVSASQRTVDAHSAPPVDAAVVSEPRFTFRVVGHHVDDRQQLIWRLRIGDRLALQREPSNPYDYNAVAVFDPSGRMLGYLKREVAEWFAPMLDAGEIYYCDVHRIRDEGALIVGVYET